MGVSRVAGWQECRGQLLPGVDSGLNKSAEFTTPTVWAKSGDVRRAILLQN